jgi:hypothetical protein
MMVRLTWSVVAVALVLSACGGGGDGGGGRGKDVDQPSVPAATRSSSGPGDTERLWPTDQGNVWVYDMQDVAGGVSTTSYETTVSVLRSETVGDATRLSMREDTRYSSGQMVSVEDYLVDRGGVTFVSTSGGVNASADALIAGLGGYREMLFPATSGRFLAFDKPGLDLGEDVDGDGKHEVIDLRMDVTMVGYEAVTVPAGSFARAAKYQKHLVQRVSLSGDGSVIEVTVNATMWHAPGIGLVKTVMEMSHPQFGVVSTVQTLRAYVRGGVTGVVSHGSAESAYGAVMISIGGPSAVAPVGATEPPSSTASEALDPNREAFAVSP